MRNWEEAHSTLTFFGYIVWKRKQLPFKRAMGGRVSAIEEVPGSEKRLKFLLMMALEFRRFGT